MKAEVLRRGDTGYDIEKYRHGMIKRLGPGLALETLCLKQLSEGQL